MKTTRKLTVSIMAPVTVDLDVEFDDNTDPELLDFRVKKVWGWRCNDITVGDVDAALGNDSDLCDDLIERLARGE